MSERQTVKRKWSVEKSAGPLVLLAEILQKRLIQHAYPCEYTSYKKTDADGFTTVYGVEFHSSRGRPPLGPKFWEAFDTVLRIVAYEKNLSAWREDGLLYLDGIYHVNKYGVIRRGLPPCPF